MDIPEIQKAPGKKKESITDAEIVIRYREAIDILAYVGIFKDAERLKKEIETGEFSLEYEYIKNAAIELDKKTN